MSNLSLQDPLSDSLAWEMANVYLGHGFSRQSTDLIRCKNSSKHAVYVPTCELFNHVPYTTVLFKSICFLARCEPYFQMYLKRSNDFVALRLNHQIDTGIL